MKRGWSKTRTESVVTALIVVLLVCAPVRPDRAAVGGGETRTAPLPVESGFVDVDGGRLYYERAGTGETIVLIHDGLVHREIWDEQFGFFSKDHDVIRYDRRGYGSSPPPEAPYSNVDDLKRLFDQLKIEKACLIGMSAGGGLAIDFALECPEKVTALVLVGAVVSGFDYTMHMFTRGGHLKADDQASTDAAIEYWSMKDPYEMALGSVEARQRVRAFIAQNPQNLDDGKYHFQKQPARPALQALSEIRVPTLIIVGEYDIPDVHAHAGAIDAGIPNARRIVMSNAGHLVPFEQPAAFNETVLTFMKEEPFFILLNSNGAVAAVAKFNEARAADPKAFVFSEDRMNLTGYQYVASGKIAEAIELFKLNVLAYPDSWNAFDSLGEAYMIHGDRELAIKNYRRSLELNSQNQNAKDKLKQLGVEE